MPAAPTPKRLTVTDIARRKGGEKLVCLTAYTAPFARILDAHADVLLVGDSLGMVIHGMATTVGVSLEMMCLHGKAVASHTHHALVAVDLPFGSYEGSPRQAHRVAARILGETGCQAIKLEAFDGVAETISFLVKRGVPVIGHVGLRPQAVHAQGGFRVKGRRETEHEEVVAEAQEADSAGAFALVVEGVTAELAAEVTRSVSCPTIGIGAAPSCDGQILVTEDMLGLFEWVPKFVRRYADLRSTVESAVRAYASDVRSGTFPSPAELYLSDHRAT